MTFAPSNTLASYLPSDFDLPREPEELRNFILNRERLTASIINVKEIAQYERSELLSGQQWYSTVAVTDPLTTRYGFRVVADLVALNGGPIGPGATPLVLSAVTIPSQILGSTIPLPSGGSATTATGVYLFLNENRVFVDFTPATQTITITNNFGANLTQCYFEFEYLKQ